MLHYPSERLTIYIPSNSETMRQVKQYHVLFNNKEEGREGNMQSQDCFLRWDSYILI